MWNIPFGAGRPRHGRSITGNRAAAQRPLLIVTGAQPSIEGRYPLDRRTELEPNFHSLFNGLAVPPALFKDSINGV